MEKLIAYCGLNCASCDEELRPSKMMMNSERQQRKNGKLSIMCLICLRL